MNKNRLSRLLVWVSILLVFLSLLPTYAGALEVNGNATGGSANGNTTAGGTYSVTDTTGTGAIAYRFTIVDSGGNRKYAPIDVYRSTLSYMGYNKPDTKLTKKQYATGYTSISWSTTTATTNCYYDSDLGLEELLPVSTTDMTNWGMWSDNLDPIIDKINPGSSSSSVTTSGMCILVEPIYRIQIDGVFYNFTVSEMAFFTGMVHGWDTTPKSNANNGSFYFIAQYTNGYYPNSLKFSKTMFGLTAGGALNTNINGSFASARTILTMGYGAMVIFDNNASEGETPKEYKLTIRYYTGKDNVTYTNYNGVAKNYAANSKFEEYVFESNKDYPGGLNTYTLTSPGYHWTAKWKTKDGKYVVKEDTSFNKGTDLAKALGVDISNKDATIDLHAVWDENKLTVNYYTNCSDATYTDYDGNKTQYTSNSKMYSYVFGANQSYSAGLANLNVTRPYYHMTGNWVK